MSRIRWVTSLLLMLVPAALGAQQADTARAPADTSVMQQAYQQQRAALLHSLDSTQAALAQVRGQRVQLEAQLDNAIAQATERRAQALLLSDDQRALLELDSTLSAAQDAMQTQRDRMRDLGDAVRRRSGAVLVVLLRADSTESPGLAGADLSVDGAAEASRTYSAIAAHALGLGAVDQLYRAAVLPTAHRVALAITLNGQAVTQGLEVDAHSGTVTYVRFTVQHGAVTADSWSSQGTAPY
jgi:hypothetical protein